MRAGSAKARRRRIMAREREQVRGEMSCELAVGPSVAAYDAERAVWDCVEIPRVLTVPECPEVTP